MSPSWSALSRLGPSVLLVAAVFGQRAEGSEEPDHARYFAHEVVEDRYGVIAPWCTKQNGPCDERIRIAAETLKRYPWAEPPLSAMAAPHFVFNGSWDIDRDGTIRIDPKLSDWANGDLGQRSAQLLVGMTNYYRYSGDPAAIGIIDRVAAYLLDHCQTPADHPWPGFLISVPARGKAYREASPRGFIQLDFVGLAGSGMVAAYKLTGNPRYLEAAKRWADLLAHRCNPQPGQSPWNRYANPEDVRWSNTMTGGVVLVLGLLDDLIEIGYRGDDDCLVKARDAGEAHLREVLLPNWHHDPVWGHHFWDWPNEVNTCTLVALAPHYLMSRAEAFPNWRNDVRNVTSFFFARTSADAFSEGGVYSGAWAAPESTTCCGPSLQYPNQLIAGALARFGSLTDDPWAQEVARRQALLTTYDAHETGVVDDNIHGGYVVAGSWFNLAHPWPLRAVLDMVAWQPQWLGAARENHIVRSSSVVQHVVYDRGRVGYRTFDATAPCEDVLRLAFEPSAVTADGKPLGKHDAQQGPLPPGTYTVKPLANGDCLVTVRHDGYREVLVEGPDPQQQAKGASEFEFVGNQVRLLGNVGPDGGKADVYVDGKKQLCGIDFWCPEARERQIVWYRSGLPQGKHSIEVIAQNARNPCSKGTKVEIVATQWSNAQGTSGFGEGAGPKDAQRVIFGFVGREPYCDTQGHLWRPATEFTLRLHVHADLAPSAMSTERRLNEVAGTSDPELYRYGVRGHEFTTYFTVAPTETYHVRLKFCQAKPPKQPGDHATNIDLQGQTVVSDMDIAATAGGFGKAVDLVFNDVRPVNGMIAIHFWHRGDGKAMVQAIEVGPGKAPSGAKPVVFRFPAGNNLLSNAGFEKGLKKVTGTHRPLHPDFNIGFKEYYHDPSSWSYRFLADNTALAMSESERAKPPQVDPPRSRSGKEALAVCGESKPTHTQVYQTVRVAPGRRYRVSAWVLAVDRAGKGFGKNPGDGAGLILHELDKAGEVLVEHPAVAVTEAGPYRELTREIVTNRATASIRFVLDTQIGCDGADGHVTYDDCELIEQTVNGD